MPVESTNRLWQGKTMEIERRRYQRFGISDRAFAAFQPEPAVLVPITDISMGGLGLSAIESDEQINSSSQLELMAADCSFYMPNLSFDLIPTFKTFSVDHSNLPDGRHFGIQFEKLMPNQRSQLKYFIRSYTKGGLAPQFIRNLAKMMNRIRANKDSGASCHGILQSSQSPIV